jgi:hypothetical protein
LKSIKVIVFGQILPYMNSSYLLATYKGILFSLKRNKGWTHLSHQ